MPPLPVVIVTVPPEVRADVVRSVNCDNRWATDPASPPSDTGTGFGRLTEPAVMGCPMTAVRSDPEGSLLSHPQYSIVVSTFAVAPRRDVTMAEPGGCTTGPMTAWALFCMMGCPWGPVIHTPLESVA